VAGTHPVCESGRGEPVLTGRELVVPVSGNDDGGADLLVLSVDRTLTGPECGATAAAHDDPKGWAGLRLFDVSDPAAPRLLTGVYQDCGSHTNTLLPDEARNRLLVLNSSYPLRPGPTCGPVRGP
jgi:hypothetical protein